MALVTEHQKVIYSKVGNTEIIPTRDSTFVLAGGRVTPVKTRINMSPSPENRQVISDLNQLDSTKHKTKESTKTSAEFYSTGKKRPTQEEKELFSQYPPVNKQMVQPIPVKNNKEEKRSTSVRNSSILRQRIERDIVMSDHSQDFIDQRLQENRLGTKAPLIRSGKYAMQSGSELNQSYSGFGSQDQLHNDFPVRYSSNPNGSTKLSSSANQVVIKNKITPPIRESMRLNFEDNPDNQYPPGSNSQASSKTKEVKSSSNTPQFKDPPRKVALADEKKKRVDALEKYVESNYGGDKSAQGSDGRDSADMIDGQKNDFGNTKVVPVIPSEKPHQFRRNMYLKTQSTGEKTVPDSELQDSEYRNLNRSRILNSFEKELDTLAEDQIDVEEMHYFFVNFHQKSKQLMAKMK